MAKLHQTLNPIQTFMIVYLTIIPRARMGSESRVIGSEPVRARGIIVLVKSN